MADGFAQTVKAQTDVVRILGEYLKLRKSGANWSALCPFHKEKSGSFYVYPHTASYYCFGCHEHGDVFTFVMKMESVSFPEAVRSVATKMGIALPQREFGSPEEAREAGLRRQLLEVHEAATQYFQQNLRSPEAARAREYMTGRGIDGGDGQGVSARICAGELQRHARAAGQVLSRGRCLAGEWAVQLEGAGRWLGQRAGGADVCAKFPQAGDVSDLQRSGQADRVHGAGARERR